MAQYDLDDSPSDPLARRSNRLALVGVIAMFALTIGASYMQSHPWEIGMTGPPPSRSTWFDDVRYQGRAFQAGGASLDATDTDFQPIGTTSDGRAVYVGTAQLGGGGGGAGQQLFLRLAPDYYQPIKLR